VGSSPITSTQWSADHLLWDEHAALGFMLGGLVAGEGCFSVTVRSERFVADGSERLRFVFQVTMASRDRHLLDQLQGFLGAGKVTEAPSRKPQ
jgi:hypothetical protein